MGLSWALVRGTRPGLCPRPWVCLQSLRCLRCVRVQPLLGFSGELPSPLAPIGQGAGSASDGPPCRLSCRLFPLREPGVNWHAKPLTLREIQVSPGLWEPPGSHLQCRSWNAPPSL